MFVSSHLFGLAHERDLYDGHGVVATFNHNCFACTHRDEPTLGSSQQRSQKSHRIKLRSNQRGNIGRRPRGTTPNRSKASPMADCSRYPCSGLQRNTAFRTRITGTVPMPSQAFSVRAAAISKTKRWFFQDSSSIGLHTLKQAA